ncbi:unnamed protein product [Adineta ricciae]|nr:unnamed protein product [Adineta ricciae]
MSESVTTEDELLKTETQYSNGTTLDDLVINKGSTSNESHARLRRSCDCWTSTGRCVSYGDYQCWFQGGAWVVQCLGDGHWEKIRRCRSGCKRTHSDRALCH